MEKRMKARASRREGAVEMAREGPPERVKARQKCQRKRVCAAVHTTSKSVSRGSYLYYCVCTRGSHVQGHAPSKAEATRARSGSVLSAYATSSACTCTDTLLARRAPAAPSGWSRHMSVRREQAEESSLYDG
eukprot:1999094-Rhodomonas_salina.1